MRGDFWDRVDRRVDDECWPWRAGKTASGYGSLNKEVWGESVAHRLAWRLANNAEIPEGRHWRHLEHAAAIAKAKGGNDG